VGRFGGVCTERAIGCLTGESHGSISRNLSGIHGDVIRRSRANGRDAAEMQRENNSSMLDASFISDSSRHVDSTVSLDRMLDPRFDPFDLAIAPRLRSTRDGDGDGLVYSRLLSLH